MPELLAETAVLKSMSLAARTIDPSQFVYSGLLLSGGGRYTGEKLVDRVRAEPTLAGTSCC